IQVFLQSFWGNDGPIEKPARPSRAGRVMLIRWRSLRSHIILAVAVENTPAQDIGKFAAVYGHLPVDEEIVDSFGKLVGIGELGNVVERGEIEHHDVSRHVWEQETAIVEPMDSRWQAGHRMDRRRKGNDL